MYFLELNSLYFDTGYMLLPEPMLPELYDAILSKTFMLETVSKKQVYSHFM